MSKDPAPSKAYEAAKVDGRTVITWRNLAGHDKGAAFALPPHNGMMVEIAGTFGTTGSLGLEGSVGGASFALIEDDRGRTVYANRPIMTRSLSSPRLLRPYAVGDEKTNLTVTIAFDA